MKDPKPQELAWYRKHGRFPKERIRMSRPTASLRRMPNLHEVRLPAQEYVVGDWSWNRGNHPSEWIEHQMRMEGVYD